MPDYQNLIERDSRGISLTAVLDAFNETSTWYDFILRLCFETHGVQVITLFAALAFLTYRLSGSPLDVSLEEKQCEREELWAAHNERFKPRKVRLGRLGREESEAMTLTHYVYTRP
jgi:hypothetical protein